MGVVAGDEKDGMLVATGDHANTSDLSPFIDVKLADDFDVGCGNDEGIHVNDGTAVLRKESRPAADADKPPSPPHLAN